MFVVCKPDLSRQDFERIQELVSAAAFELKWGKRAGRLVLIFEPSDGSDEAVEKLLAAPGIDYVLRSPSPAEIARTVSRRDLLDAALLGTGIMCGAALLGPLALYLSAPGTDRPTRGEHAIGRAATLVPGNAYHRLIDGEEYIVVRRDERHFHVLSATCTHSEICLVKWDKERRQLVCPCHRGVFDLNGNVISGPPPRPLAQLKTHIRDGTLYVQRPR